MLQRRLEAATGCWQGPQYDRKCSFFLIAFFSGQFQQTEISERKLFIFHHGSHTQQRALESGQDAWIVQIDFNAAFDRVKNLGILYKLCSVGIGGSVLSLLTQFLSNPSQQVMVDGCRSKLVSVVSGAPQGSIFTPLLFLLYTSELFSILENKLISCANDSTLMAVVPSLGVRVAVAESLIQDLGRVSEWCDLWGMKLNASKKKDYDSLEVSHNASPVTPINYWRDCAEGV